MSMNDIERDRLISEYRAAFAAQWPFLDVVVEHLDNKPAACVKFQGLSPDVLVRFAVRGGTPDEMERAFKSWARDKILEPAEISSVAKNGHAAVSYNKRLSVMQSAIREWANTIQKRRWLGMPDGE